MDLLELIIEYHKDNERQGPGSEEATLKALSYIPQLNEKSKVLDIGCGSGGQTITLAKNTAAQITAVDMLPQFLDQLQNNAKENNLINRITTKEMLMDGLTFDENYFDVIWSEGAIYNIGFEKGLSLWRKYLKANGYIAVSEISCFERRSKGVCFVFRKAGNEAKRTLRRRDGRRCKCLRKLS